jgi:hypothetical protein
VQLASRAKNYKTKSNTKSSFLRGPAFRA